jgi:hypothetical protein
MDPEKCGTTDGYITDPGDPGVSLHHSTLAAAFLAGKRVSLVLSGCNVGRPRIIGVSILP